MTYILPHISFRGEKTKKNVLFKELSGLLYMVITLTKHCIINLSSSFPSQLRGGIL